MPPHSPPHPRAAPRPQPRPCARRLRATRWATAWAAAVALATTAAAHARAEEGRVWTRLTAYGAADALRGTDGLSAPWRRAGQEMRLSGWYGPDRARPAATAQPHLAMEVALRLDADLGLEPPFAERQDRDGAAILTPTLLLAYVEAQRVAGLFDARVGRQLVVHPAGALDLDGVRVTVGPSQGWQWAAWLGQPVRESPSPLGRSGWGDGGAVGRDAPAAASAALASGMALGLSQPRVRAQLALQRVALLDATPDALPSDDDDPTAPPQPPVAAVASIPAGLPLQEDRAGLAFYALPSDALELHLASTLNLAFGDLDRVHAEVAARVAQPRAWATGARPDAGELWVGVGAEAWRPRFDLSSVFNVFGPRPQSQLRAHARAVLPIGGGQDALTAAADAHLRAWGDPDGPLPALAPNGALAHTGWGARASAAWDQTRPQSRWWVASRLGLDAQLEDGPAGLLLALTGFGRADLSRDVWLDLGLSGWHLDRPLQPGRAGATFAASLTGGVALGDWGQLTVRAEERSTASYLHATTVLASYSLDVDVLQTPRPAPWTW